MRASDRRSALARQTELARGVAGELALAMSRVRRDQQPILWLTAVRDWADAQLDYEKLRVTLRGIDGGSTRSGKTGKGEKIYWVGTAPAACQHCGLLLKKTMFDASIPSYGGRWAIVGDCCAELAQVRTGLGLGQKYERQEDGRWLKTEG